jgi:hypothetical protein
MGFNYSRMELKVHPFMSTTQQHNIIQHFIHTHTRVNLQNPIFYSFHTKYNTMAPWLDTSLQSPLGCQDEGHGNLNHFSLSISHDLSSCRLTSSPTNSLMLCFIPSKTICFSFLVDSSHPFIFQLHIHFLSSVTLHLHGPSSFHIRLCTPFNIPPTFATTPLLLSCTCPM